MLSGSESLIPNIEVIDCPTQQPDNSSVSESQGHRRILPRSRGSLSQFVEDRDTYSSSLVKPIPKGDASWLLPSQDVYDGETLVKNMGKQFQQLFQKLKNNPSVPVLLAINFLDEVRLSALNTEKDCDALYTKLNNYHVTLDQITKIKIYLLIEMQYFISRLLLLDYPYYTLSMETFPLQVNFDNARHAALFLEVVTRWNNEINSLFAKEESEKSLSTRDASKLHLPQALSSSNIQIEALIIPEKKPSLSGRSPKFKTLSIVTTPKSLLKLDEPQNSYAMATLPSTATVEINSSSLGITPAEQYSSFEETDLSIISVPVPVPHPPGVELKAAEPPENKLFGTLKLSESGSQIERKLNSHSIQDAPHSSKKSISLNIKEVAQLDKISGPMLFSAREKQNTHEEIGEVVKAICTTASILNRKPHYLLNTILNSSFNHSSQAERLKYTIFVSSQFQPVQKPREPKGCFFQCSQKKVQPLMHDARLTGFFKMVAGIDMNQITEGSAQTIKMNLEALTEEKEVLVKKTLRRYSRAK